MSTRRGDLARASITGRIIEAFGPSFVCQKDKKIYVNCADGPGGELLQFAISLTMPKTPVVPTPATPWDSPDPTPPKYQISTEDAAAVDKLLKDLGLPTD